jgi:hypothetical protein
MYRMCLSKWREQELEGAGSDNTLMLGRPGPAGLLAQSSMPRRCVCCFGTLTNAAVVNWVGVAAQCISVLCCTALPRRCVRSQRHEAWQGP